MSAQPRIVNCANLLPSSHPRLGEHRGKADRMNRRDGKWGREPQNAVFWMWRDRYTHKHTADILVYIRLVQDQGGQNPSMNGGGDSKNPAVLEELLAVGNYWRRESHFSLGVWLLAGCPWFHGDSIPMIVWSELTGLKGLISTAIIIDMKPLGELKGVVRGGWD